MPQSDDDRSLYSAVKGVGQICSDRQKSNLTEEAVKFKQIVNENDEKIKRAIAEDKALQKFQSFPDFIEF